MYKLKHKKLPLTLEVYLTKCIAVYKHRLTPGLITEIKYRSKTEAMKYLQVDKNDFREVPETKPRR